jgi:hypothetical protein
MHTVFTEKLDSIQLGETYKNRRLINKMSNAKIKFSLILLKNYVIKVQSWNMASSILNLGTT